MKSVIIIGSGMGGLAAGIYGQKSGFGTTIFEAHHQPGGQCTSWNRKGYVFDACIHHFSGFSPRTRFNALWRELGVLPCEMIKTRECVRVLAPDGACVHDYYDLAELESHLKQLSPEDAAVIDEYIDGIKGFTANDPLGDVTLGSLWNKLSFVPVLIKQRKYFKWTMGAFAGRFKHPLLRKAFALLSYSIPDTPMFFHLIAHAYAVTGDIAWPGGGSLAVSKKMAARYAVLGGTIRYRQRVARILTDDDRATGVELEDGTRHQADFVVSNADGRKTILQLLSGRYLDKKISRSCEASPDREVAHSVSVFLGVKRDLSSYPPALIVFLDKPEVIGGHTYDHLGMQIYGFDAGMAPPGKGVIKIELFTKPSYFSRLCHDRAAYQAEKNKIADQVITLLDGRFPGLREDIEVVDVPTLLTWERFMGGTQGFDNYPNNGSTDGESILSAILGLNQKYTLPGLKNFFLVGSWVTSAGSLAVNAFSGKTAVRMICRRCGVRLRT